MVERALCMREVPRSKLGSSRIFLVCYCRLQYVLCVRIREDHTWTFVGVKIEFLDICWGKLHLPLKALPWS